MSKRIGSIAIAAAVLACLGLGSAATANEDGPPGPGSGWRGRHGPPPIDRILERHAEELGLSDAVREQVRGVAEAAEEEQQPLDDALAEQREVLHELLSQDAPDADAVLRQADVVGAAETEVHKQRLRTLLAVRALLTPDQRRTLVQIFEERRKRMDGHRWGGGPPPEPQPPNE